MADYKIQVGNTSIGITGHAGTPAIYNVSVNVIRNTNVTGAMGTTKTPVTLVANMPCTIKWTSAK